MSTGFLNLIRRIAFGTAPATRAGDPAVPQDVAANIDASLDAVNRMMVETDTRTDEHAAACHDWLLVEAEAAGCDAEQLALLKAAFPVEQFKSVQFSLDREASRPNAARQLLFDTLLRLRDTWGWGDRIAVGIVSSPVPTLVAEAQVEPRAGAVYVACEFALCDLFRRGFSPRVDQITPLLSFALNSPARATSRLPQRFLLNATPPLELPIFRAIEKTCPTAADMPAEARDLMAQVARQYLCIGTETDWTAPASDGHLPPPDAMALMRMAGLTRDPVIDQMRRLPAPRIGAFQPLRPVDRHMALVRALDDALETLITGFEAAGGKPDWMTDPARHRALFGEWTNDDPGNVARFGWWDTPASADPAQPGFSELAHVKMCEPGAFDGRVSLVQACEAMLDDPLDAMPVSFFRGPVPEVEMFTFGGADPEGAFLEHLATTGKAHPVRGWHRATRAHLDRIGAETVGRVLTDWLSLVQEVDDRARSGPAIDCAYDGLLARAPVAALSPVGRSDPDDPHWANRRALELMIAPQSIKPRSHRTDLRDPATPLEGVGSTGVIAPLLRNVLTGVLATVPHLPAPIPPQVLERVAIFCLQQSGSDHQPLRAPMAGFAAIHALGAQRSDEARAALTRIVDAFPRIKRVRKQVQVELAAR